MTDATPVPKTFLLEFSNRVIEHLGIKLYQNKPTNVVAEFVSNGWDADATNVDIAIRASTTTGGPSIVITDDGRGMNRDDITDGFLIIGKDPREKPTDRTIGGRRPMGRKGIGKLAGFGIAKTVDVLSCPNPKLREDASGRPPLIYWLRFSLDAMLKAATPSGNGSYAPEILADGVTLERISELVAEQQDGTAYCKFLENVAVGAGGVCVHLSDTTLKKAINPNDLIKSMGRRFTVTMLRDDFIVSVLGKRIKPEDALPPMHPFEFGNLATPIAETLTINGVTREVKYWINFVSLRDSEWSIENAGIGVYAHGKIAQDRPFFFDVKGKEIFSRYIYGVIEADWIDELAEDVVSTDRRSMNWESNDTEGLHTWGAAKLTYWLDEFKKWRAKQAKDEVVSRIRSVSPKSKLSAPEETALADLLQDILPSFGNNEEAKDTTTASFTQAWTHAPTRKLTHDLWNKVFATGGIEPAAFASIIAQLKDSLVPEALGLAVTMAQRIAAITAMRKMIEKEKTETDLQHLIETFPWLLGPQWELLAANLTIRTLVSDKHSPNESMGEWSLTKSDGGKRPDFVFLSDVGGTKEFVVFELKGPECGKTLLPSEYMQLRSYLDIISSSCPGTNVLGILVGHDKGGFDETDKRITVLRWADVLLAARSLHVSYLMALLKIAEPDADDARLRQIADFGGKETLELLTKMIGSGALSDEMSGTIRALCDTTKAAP